MEGDNNREMTSQEKVQLSKELSDELGRRFGRPLNRLEGGSLALLVDKRATAGMNVGDFMIGILQVSEESSAIEVARELSVLFYNVAIEEVNRREGEFFGGQSDSEDGRRSKVEELGRLDAIREDVGFCYKNQEAFFKNPDSSSMERVPSIAVIPRKLAPDWYKI